MNKLLATVLIACSLFAHVRGKKISIAKWTVKTDNNYTFRVEKYYDATQDFVQWEVNGGENIYKWFINDEILEYYYPETYYPSIELKCACRSYNATNKTKDWKDWESPYEYRNWLENESDGTGKHVVRLAERYNHETPFCNVQHTTCGDISNKTKIDDVDSFLEKYVFNWNKRQTRAWEEMGVRRLTGLKFDYNKNDVCTRNFNESHVKLRARKLKKSLDLREMKALSPVKDQDTCGSCWAFGVVAAVEGAYFKKTGQSVVLSEQALIDCSWGRDNGGCFGGNEQAAFEWIKNYGLPKTRDYGNFKSYNGICNEGKEEEDRIYVKGCHFVDHDVDAIKVALNDHGPLVLSVFLPKSFGKFDGSWVITDSTYDKNARHTMAIVGYGRCNKYDKHSKNKNGCFVIRNSWGTDWGDEGYVYVEQSTLVKWLTRKNSALYYVEIRKNN